MAIYKGNTKVSGVGKGFNPENSGTVGQVLTKTSTGYTYDDIPEVTVDSALSTTSENPVQNKVITNAIQNAGGASDHLEAKGLVGELYQLTDTMFLQSTPTLVNSTVEQNVGDTANNTQIHIQRIGSGTGSNELKLKVKKVGTPGDLSVQVMKGVKVTVTADVEAYWYGDSNNILASGTVSASSITTSWQEITVTLNNQVGGTEGELLDIVLSIPSINASNYVVIACDSTQWSEGFSLVAVNGSTRTRSKLMPYCISDGFAQGLLCKATSNTIIGYESDNFLFDKGSSFTTPSKTNNERVYDITGFEKRNSVFSGSISTITLYNTLAAKDLSSISVSINGTSILSGVSISRSNTYTQNNFNFSIPANTDLKVTVTCPGYEGSNENVRFVALKKLSLTGKIAHSLYKNGNIKGKPREIKDISQKATTTIFGVHIDNTWVSQS